MSNALRKLKRTATRMQAGLGPSDAPGAYDAFRLAAATGREDVAITALNVPGPTGVLFFLAARGDSLEEASELLQVAPAAINRRAQWILNETERDKRRRMQETASP